MSLSVYHNKLSLLYFLGLSSVQLSGEMAPASLRFHLPHRLPSQQRAWLSSPTFRSGECLPRRRRLLVCSSSDPHSRQRPANEEGQLRAEISPSVLRALQPQDASPSANPSGESLIERNLRKRAMSHQASSSSSSLEEPLSAPVSGDGERSNLSLPPETQGDVAPSTTSGKDSSLSADRSSFPASDGGEGFPRYAMSSSSCPVTAAFWQEAPPGFDIEGYHNIDFYAWVFRIFLVCSVAFVEGSEYLTGLYVSSLLWLLQPMDVLPRSSLGSDEDKLGGPKKDVAERFSRVMDNQDVVSLAFVGFSALWSSEAWMKRATSGKASQFVLALAYSVYVCILSGTGDCTARTKKKLEEYSVLLNQSLTQLHGRTSNPLQIWEKALKATSFASEGTAFVCDYAVIFPCKVKFMEGCSKFGSMLEQVQNCLDEEFKDSDLVVLLQRSSDKPDEVFIVVAPWYWVLTLDFEQLPLIPDLLSLLSCLATCCFSGAGTDFGISWEQYVVPLGWAGILASLYFTNDQRLSTVCPFPSLGAVGKIFTHYGIMPSRSSLIGAIFKHSCPPLCVSLLLFTCGFVLWGPSHSNIASVIDFRGYVLVPPDLFSYSSLLTNLLRSASVATIEGEDGVFKLAASPFVVAGLLGFNFTAFSLFPGLHNYGGYLLRSLLGRKRLANQISYAFTVLLSLSLCVKDPFLGLAWIVVSLASKAGCYVKDDVSDAGFVPSLAGSLLMAAAVACFVPLWQ